ncbi:MAG: hypothetical protein WCZ86_06280 [Desulfurivibrionaceae bacterium]
MNPATTSTEIPGPTYVIDQATPLDPVDAPDLPGDDAPAGDTPADPPQDGEAPVIPAEGDAPLEDAPAGDTDETVELPDSSGVDWIEAYNDRILSGWMDEVNIDPALREELQPRAVYEQGLNFIEFMSHLSTNDPTKNKAALLFLGLSIGAVKAVEEVDSSTLPSADDLLKIAENPSDLTPLESQLVAVIQVLRDQNDTIVKEASKASAAFEETATRSIKNQTDATILGQLSKVYPGETFDAKAVRESMVEFGVTNPAHAVILSRNKGAGAPKPDGAGTGKGSRMAAASTSSGGTADSFERVITKDEQLKLSAWELAQLAQSGAKFQS